MPTSIGEKNGGRFNFLRKGQLTDNNTTPLEEKMKTKMMCIILAACMLLTLMPAVSFAEPTHSHCECGGNTLVGTHTSHSSDVTYQPWNPGQTPSFDSNGNYYLTGNVTLESTVQINKTVRICLNGYTITCEKDVPMELNSYNFSHLILCDCKGTGKFKGCESDSVYNSGPNEARGGCVCLYYGRLTAYGVEFTGSRVRSGGAINCNTSACIVNLFNVKITNNRATKNGAAYSRFGYGGGITLNGGNLNMYGGEITGNSADVYGGAIVPLEKATVNLDGVKITNNTAGYFGGAIYYGYDTKINLKGDTVMMNNKCGKDEHNIYIGTGKYTVINADGLTKNAKIGISFSSELIEPGKAFVPPVFATADDASRYKNFFADNKNYYVNYTEENGRALLNISDTAACDHVGGSATCKKRAVCERCGKEYGSFAEHNFAKLVNNVYRYSEADCVTPAKYREVCTLCDAVGKIFEYGSALGHNEVTDAAKAPTCTETGLTEGSHCSVCNEVFTKQNVIASLGHKWNNGEVTKEATPGVKGERTFTCSVCKGTRVEEIPALPTYKKGDVDANDRVDVSDARLALRAAVKLDTLTGTAFLAADVDGDNAITVGDARMILRVAVKLDTFDD